MLKDLFQPVTDHIACLMSHFLYYIDLQEAVADQEIRLTASEENIQGIIKTAVSCSRR